MRDRILGISTLSLLLFGQVYWAAWLLAAHFITAPAASPFAERKWAAVVPAFGFTVILGVAGALVGCTVKLAGI
jgi:hypothetical protein